MLYCVRHCLKHMEFNMLLNPTTYSCEVGIIIQTFFLIGEPGFKSRSARHLPLHYVASRYKI